MYSDHWLNLRAGEFSDGFALFNGKPQNTPMNSRPYLSLSRLASSNPLAGAGLLLIAIFLFCAVCAPWVSPHDPARIDLPNRLERPSLHHWFGTDELGRDILSRVIYGSRISMVVGASVVAGVLFPRANFWLSLWFYWWGGGHFFLVCFVYVRYAFFCVF